MEEQDYSESTYTEEQNSQIEPDYKIAEGTSNSRLKGFFVSANAVNLSNHKLSKAGVSLLSKGLKFCPTPSSVDKSVLKEDLEKSGKTSRLKWHYRNDEWTFDPNPFRPKFKFNPSKTDVAIELYLSHIEEKLLSCTEFKNSCYNLTRKEPQAIYNLKKDHSIVMGSAVVIWIKRITLWRQKNNFLVKKLMKKFQVAYLFSLKLFVIPLKKFEKKETYLVIL